MKNLYHTINQINIDKFIRRVLPFYLLSIFTITILYSFYNYLIHQPYTIGDWLINYQGGFVRRGFIGEVVYFLSKLTAINPGQLVVLLHAFFYAIFFIFSYLILIKQENLQPYILLIFSPFIFIFQIYDYGGGYRKELIYLAIMAFTVWSSYLHKRTFEKIFFITVLFYPLVILSHEILAIFLPFLLSVYFLRADINLKKIIPLVLILLISCFAFILSVLYKGNIETVESIFQSLVLKNYKIDGGSISWLDKNTDYALYFTQKRIKEYNYMVKVFFALVFVMVAFIPIFKNIFELFKNKLVFILMTTSFLGTCALSMIAIDWGRWIYILAVSLFLLTLTYNKGRKLNFAPDKKIYLIIFSMLYFSIWSIPHTIPFRLNISYKYFIIFRPAIPIIRIINYYNENDASTL